MLKIKQKIGVLIILSLMCGMTYAASSPLPMLKTTADKMLSELRQNQSQLKDQSTIIYRIVNKNLIPHVDQYAMARSVVTRNAWNAASISNRKQFINEFRKVVVRTYAKAISRFTNESVQFRPVRRGDINGKSATVHSRIIRPGRTAIPVTYRLNLSGNKWKIVDFSVDGVSMVSSFRAQFSGITNSAQGLALLNKKLAQHNANRNNTKR